MVRHGCGAITYGLKCTCPNCVAGVNCLCAKMIDDERARPRAHPRHDDGVSTVDCVFGTIAAVLFLFLALGIIFCAAEVAKGEPLPLVPDVVQLGPPRAPKQPDALDEVNAKRATRGLRPFIRDEGLTQAAQAAARYRADHLLFGHVMDNNMGDFRFLPAGTQAASAGCAAYPASYGWLSCCTWENYTYGGAAWVTGRDGKRYMHLFVR